MADHLIIQLFPTIFCPIVFLLFLSKGVSGATFTLTNKCDFTVWPGILTGSGSSKLGSTGFELPRGSSQSFQGPTGWSGRFWGRTGCNFDSSGGGSCATGDCGSGKLECDGAGATPPATLAEFTLGSGSQDFYDVSLVDGYNLPMMVEVSGGSGDCAATGCVTDLNTRCPTELRVEGGGACRSACDAFGTPEYCCSGEYNTPAACKPSMYSEIFKSACPRSYSYAYDDATSTFTCTAADYTITFCPNSPSLKPSEVTPSTSTSNDEPPSTVQGGSDPEPEPEPEPIQIGALAGSSLLANLATGESSSTTHQYWNWIHFFYALLIVATNSIILLFHNY